MICAVNAFIPSFDWSVRSLSFDVIDLADGFAAEWLACLDRLERKLIPSAVLYAGHGAPGGSALIDAQRQYVRSLTGSVERHLSKSPETRRAAVVADMKRLLPTDALAFLMELSVDPYAAKIGETSTHI
jgi:glyoxylase-like metal-dependent hydrolase (beta-lactamase superfamily II)